MEKISFVIPCYGSEPELANVVGEIQEVISSHEEYEYEIVLVNDYSPDNVWQVICELAHKDSRIKGISLARNFGQHAALLAGYHQCTGDIVVSLDDDGQSPVDEVFKLIDEIHNGYDVVYGTYPEIKQSKFRIFGSWVNEKMNVILLDKPKGLKGTSFYAAKKFIIDEMLRYKNAYPYVGGLVLRSTKNIGTVEVQHRSRAQGQSGYTFGKLLKLWFNGFTAFSEKPLRIATILGMCCALIGFVYGIITIVRKLLIPTVQTGYSSMMAIILFIGGIIMLLLGIIGEYIGRIYISINNAPQYVIAKSVGMKDSTEKTS